MKALQRLALDWHIWFSLGFHRVWDMTIHDSYCQYPAQASLSILCIDIIISIIEF